MTTRYEQAFYGHIERIAKATERIAAALEQRNVGDALDRPMTRDQAERLARGALDHLRGVDPIVRDRREEPPGIGDD